MDDTEKLIKLATIVSDIRRQLSELSSKTEQVSKIEGPQGPKGDKGDKGLDGRDGKDGLNGKDGKDGVDGKDGQDGISVVNLEIAADNHLVVTLSDGTEIDAGLVNTAEAAYIMSSSKTNLINAVDYLDFNTQQTGIVGGVGRLVWNATDGTLDLGLGGGQVTLQIGQEMVQPVTNRTGSTLLETEVVYVEGALGNRMTVQRAQANAEMSSTAVLGVITEPILNNQTGYVTTEGMVRNVNTSAFPEGSVIWLSPTVAGGLTTTKPIAPNHTVMIGYCVRQHATVGSIYVKVQNGYELDELHNVQITTPADGQVLKYEASTGLWKNGTVSGGGGAETDPVYTASSWYTTTNNSSNWNTAYSWGNHASAGYLTSYTETDPIYTTSSWYTTTNNSVNWNTAYGWGNHASAGYLTSAAIGTTVQAYDADLTSWAAITPSSKQDTLVSGTNIKTINGSSVLGSGDLVVTGAAPTGFWAATVDELSATQSSTATGLADITGLGEPMVANGIYKVDAFITFQSAATTTGLNLGFTSPTGSICQLEVVIPITSTAAASQLRTIFPNATATNTGNVLGTGVTAINSNHTAHISGLVHCGGTAGNFQLRFATEVSGSAITLQIGSSLVMQRIA